ncbi:helix-turn-helix transcriptional regulator [Chelativorans sp. Marseille-P2723]|uniref:helix-turn-helix domain-containing protein n=1 Tax=Chelativorans sp. Marseille-P2723 TaxID=2709133 RepID=UPI00157089C8|nr:helix-turn-helix transcriptional regulator [Chelativorans sp. Marseille-P2723]
MTITPEQCKAARILAKIDRNTLAREADVAANSISAFESGVAMTDGPLTGTLQKALESLGVIFLPEESGHGVGVRLKFDRTGAKQISRWETEGGAAADDDVP